ncbi:MAG: hypothetical protein R3277_13010 [Brumimicrobium sp.]|nr:hypothetical protein [Brumimicrobium sp.]
MLDNTSEIQNEKRPVFLIVLAVLSFISIGISFIVNLLNLIQGPKSPEALEQEQVSAYEAIGPLKQQGMESFVEMIEKSIAMTIYINNEIFYLYNTLTLLSLIVGLVGVILMLRLKKIGFHLYVIYSLLPIVLMYALIPMNFIVTFYVILTVVFSALFCVLYGINLKYMK